MDPLELAMRELLERTVTMLSRLPKLPVTIIADTVHRLLRQFYDIFDIIEKTILKEAKQRKKEHEELKPLTKAQTTIVLECQGRINELEIQIRDLEEVRRKKHI